jgi:hypothetical protein
VSLADVFVAVRPDTKRFPHELDRDLNSSGVRGAADRSGKKAGGRFSGAFKNALKIGGAVAAGLSVAYLKDAVGAAADLGETLSKNQQLFGDRGGNAIAKWAEDASTSLGQTKQQALDAAGTFAVFGKSAELRGRELTGFSTQMTEVASDLASFHNAKPEDAIQALGAALRGEAEPMRKYGVMLDDATLKAEALALGIMKPVKDEAKIKSYHIRVTELQKKYNDTVEEHGKKSVEALKAEAALGTARSSLQKATEGTIPTLTAQQKVLAARSAIMKQTSDAQGDFARTSDSLANQQRILTAQWEDAKIAVGNGLLPAVTRFVTFLNSRGIPFVKDAAAAFKRDFLPPIRTLAAEVWPKLTAAAKKFGAFLVSPLTPTIKAIVGWFNEHRGVTITLTSAIAALVAITKVHAAVMAVQAAGGIMAMIRATKILTTVTKTWTAVQWLLNAALRANPIGLVITAIGLLATGLVTAYKKSETFRSIVTGSFDAVTKSIGWAIDKFERLLGLFSQDWGWIKEKIGGGLGGGIEQLATEAEGAATIGSGNVLPKGAYSTGMPYLGYPGHYGADYPAATGTPVYAVATGTVSRAMTLAGSYGKHIFLGHPGGRESRYAHLSEMFVQAGQQVAKGQLIGKVGSTGNSTGPHLHYEDRLNGRPRNPASLGIFDVGGLLRSGGLAVNLSGKPERVLDPRTTENFERLTQSMDRDSTRSRGAQRIVLDVGGGKTLTGIIRDEIDSDGSFTRTTGRMR